MRTLRKHRGKPGFQPSLPGLSGRTPSASGTGLPHLRKASARGIYAPADTCADCRNDPPEFDMARAWGPYQGNLRTLLRAYKYKGLRPLSGPLSRLLIQVFKQNFPESCECIIPVPLHRKRLAERGYDQALLLADRLSTETGIPVLQCMTRKKETLPQYGLSSARRKQNLAGAFTLERNLTANIRRILVVDDVYTTGSTVSAMCKCLKDNSGVNFIGVLTVARAIRHGPGS